MGNSVIKIWKERTLSDTEGISPSHQHHLHELLLLLEGEIEMHIAGHTYQISPGHLIFISHVEMHDLRPIHLPYHRYGMHITADGLRDVTSNPMLASIFTHREENFCHVVDVRSCLPEITAHFEKMYQESAAPGSYSQEWLSDTFGLLLIELYRQRPSCFPVVNSHMNQSLLDAQQYMEQHFSEKLTIESLAARFFFSTSHFIFAFRQATSYTPGRYLLLYRLAQSRSMLAGTQFTIAEIASKCGFSDSGNFIRCFRREAGMTPGQYRQYLSKE